MKKVILFSLVAAMILMFGSLVTAKKPNGVPLPAPTDFQCTHINDEDVCFSWSTVEGAVKYSLDVEVEVTNTGFEGRIVELSFSAHQNGLCIAAEDFVYDLDENPDTPPERVFGTARAKVKALNPGKGNGSQNHPFTDWCDSFDL